MSEVPRGISGAPRALGEEPRKESMNSLKGPCVPFRCPGIWPKDLEV